MAHARPILKRPKHQPCATTPGGRHIGLFGAPQAAMATTKVTAQIGGDVCDGAASGR
jgi:hypothetical protein